MPPSTFDSDSPYADLLALGNAGAPPGNPPPYLIIPHIGLTEILTDNAGHSRTNKQADLISILQLGAVAVADTTRLTGTLAYNLNWRQGIRNGRSRFSQVGFATAHATLSPDLLFFDARASVSEFNRSGLGDPNPNLLTNQEATQSYVVSGSPDLRTRVGDIGFVDLRYSATKVWFQRNTGPTVVNGIPLGPISDSTHQQATFDFRMPGTFAPRLLTDINVNASQQESSRLLGTYRQIASTFLNEFALTRDISAIGGVGYESLSNPRFASLQGQGITFDGGARWRPNADSSIMVLYGRHDLKSDIAGEIRYQFNETTYVYAIYSDAITSTQNSMARNNLNAAFGLEGPYVSSGFGYFANSPIESLNVAPFMGGIPLGFANGLSSGQNDFYRAKSFHANLHTTIYGESFSLSAYQVDSTSLTGIRQPPQLTSRGATAAWIPYLGEDYTGLAQIGYRHIKPGQGEILNFALGVNRSFGDTFSAGVRYDFIHSLGNSSIITGQHLGGYTVNSLSLRLRKTF